jgi:ABC-2 type transport system ATP-binding protein
MIESNTAAASVCSPPAVSVRGLSKCFGEKTAVDHVDLDVPEGSVFGFLGPNGSGKTTCLRMITGLLEPTSGSGTCLGHDIFRDRDRIKREIGYMTQRFSLYEDLTVQENLEFVARVYGMKRGSGAVRETIGKFALAERRRQLAGTLSGGWKQRLSLAACMLHRPRLLLLDEPTAGVDPKARREFWEEIHRLAAEGLTVLVTTHYMDEAERCTHLAYLAQGRLLARGNPESLVAESGLVTWEISGPALGALGERLRLRPEVELVAPFGTALHASGRDAGALEAAVRAETGPDHILRSGPPSLEDVFIHLMGSASNDRKNGDEARG